MAGAGVPRYAPYVAAVVLRLSGRSTEVDDLVQDVFVEATREIERLREPEAVKGWLATIAVRVCRRRLGAGRRLHLQPTRGSAQWRQGVASAAVFRLRLENDRGRYDVLAGCGEVECRYAMPEEAWRAVAGMNRDRDASCVPDRLIE